MSEHTRVFPALKRGLGTGARCLERHSGVASFKTRLQTNRGFSPGTRGGP